MDADDTCEPHRLEKQMAFLRDHCDVVMLGTGIDFIVGNRIVDGFRPLTEHSEIRRRLFQRRPGLNHPTLIVKRDAWAGVGGYRFAGAGEDLDFCLRVSDFGGSRMTQKRLYHYRLREQSLTFKTGAETQRGYAFAVACARARERGTAEPDLEQFRKAWLRRPIHRRVAQMLAIAGERLYRAIHHSPGRRPFTSRGGLPSHGRYVSSKCCVVTAHDARHETCFPTDASLAGKGRTRDP